LSQNNAQKTRKREVRYVTNNDKSTVLFLETKQIHELDSKLEGTDKFYLPGVTEIEGIPHCSTVSRNN
jgi:hypothetical protein